MYDAVLSPRPNIPEVERAPHPPRATPAEIRRLATILAAWGESDMAEKLNRMAADREPLRSLGEEGGIVASPPVVVRAHRGYLLLGVE